MTIPRASVFGSTLTICALAWGCLASAPIALAATGRVTLDVNGQRRSATIVQQSRLKRAPRATIIVLRGAGGAARRTGLSRVDRYLGLDAPAGAAGLVLAFPSAIKNRWSLDNANDVAFARALAVKLIADGVADRRRIYIAGVSSGGLLTLKILCEGTDYIAGAAILIANLPSTMAATCKPLRPMPFFALNGTADPLMPYQGGPAKLEDFKEEVLSVEATLAPFVAVAECGKTRVSTDAPDKDPTDGSRVVIEHITGCKVPIEIYRVDGGGHALPGRPVSTDRGAVIGAQNNDIDTARVLTDFFKRVSR